MKTAATPVLDMQMEPKTDTPAALPATVTASSQALSMIERFAADPQFDVTKLEALMAMRDREMDRVALADFNHAMAAAQADMKAVVADKKNKSTSSEYASYAAMDKVARPVFTKHGFGVSFDTEPSAIADHIRIMAYVSHIGGFSRTYKVDMPADGKGAKGNDVMTKTHAAGSAMTYGMRYLLKMIFNLAIGDEDDDDGNGASAKGYGEQAPEGFSAWIAEMRDVAMTGTKPLTDKWLASDNAFKNFILVRDWESMKAAAKAADKAAKDA